MKRTGKRSLKLKDDAPYEHLDFLLRETTPSDRWNWLKEAWNFWHDLESKKSSHKFKYER